MKLAILELLDRAAREGREVVLVTDLASGAQAVIEGGARVAGDLVLSDDVVSSAETALATRENRHVETGEGAFFLQVYGPALRMIVVGAVHIAQALVPMARLAGFDVTLIDPRTAFATPERFPETRILTEWAETVLPGLAPDSRTAVITLTHDPKLDEPALAAALRSPAFYIGALGSRRSAVSRNKRLARIGFSDAEIGRIHGPVGLPLGAVTPAEIAVAILAEAVKVLRTGIA